MNRFLTTIFLVILIILVYLTLFLQLVNDQKIALRVKAAGFNIGRLSPNAAKEALEKEWSQFSDEEIVLIYQNRNWSIKLNDLGFEMDSQLTIEMASQIGHQSTFAASLKEQLIALTGRYNIEPVYRVDYEKFDKKTRELFADIEEPAQNATLEYNQEVDNFSLVHSTDGTAVRRENLVSDLSKRAKSFSHQPIFLSIAPDFPTIENNEVDLALKEAERILDNAPYYWLSQDDRWIIKKERLINWMEFEPAKEEDSENEILGFSIDQDEVEKYLGKIAYNIDRPYTNARLKIEEKRAIEFRAPQDGFEIKRDQTINQFIENITAETPIKNTDIIADVSKPKIYLNQLNNLGIDTLIGQGVSNFAGSPNNRRHNIKVGAGKFNGTILEPGEEFSFLTLLGGSGPEEGFLAELVIKKDKTVPEYGGGLCQVSTTVFRAAINSGMEITFRRPHAFPVVYYSPHGFDATVYDPWPDFRFINNTSGHLLIGTEVEGNQLTFNFYGTDDERKIEVKGPYVLESKEDGSMKTTLYQVVHLNGEKILDEEFFSAYRSPDLYPVNPDEDEEAPQD